ncbi:MAG TPA: hypothetical protein VJ831_07280 [Jatrophihabitantaceae bacterium]|nr:hypothetical protein [Jatrophihabitantaceae bacterium]
MTAALAVLAALAASTAGVMSPAEAAPTPTPNVTAYGPHHDTLSANPMLSPGERVQLVVTGFGKRAHVSVLGTGSTAYRDQRADGSGTVRLNYVVPLNVPSGGHYLSFSGPPDSMPTPAFDPADTGNPNYIRATVPVFGLFPFRTPSAPREPSSGHSAGGAEGSMGGLSNTGVAVLGSLVLGFALLAAGIGIARASRAR